MRTGRIAAVWALVGITLILGDAIARVAPFAFDAIRDGLSAPQWIVLVVWVIVMVVAEGYRGFQKRLAPKVVARATDLRHDGRGVDRWLAPLYCLGYFHAARRQLITTWSLTVGIVLLIVIVRTIAQPWRGIIDAGVFAGLVYGLASIFGCLIQSRIRPS